jgi:hypothetical protein
MRGGGEPRGARAGSNVSLTLYFLRFALALNVALSLVWLACTVVPFMIWPPRLFSWAIFHDYLPLQLLQGYGLHDTFLLYGAPRGIRGRVRVRAMYAEAPGLPATRRAGRRTC